MASFYSGIQTNELFIRKTTTPPTANPQGGFLYTDDTTGNIILKDANNNNVVLSTLVSGVDNHDLLQNLTNDTHPQYINKNGRDSGPGLTGQIINGGLSAGRNLDLRANAAGLVDGSVRILTTTASNSTTTGALTVAGGVGVAGDLYAGSLNSATINGTAVTATTLTAPTINSGGTSTLTNVNVLGNLNINTIGSGTLALNLLGNISINSTTGAIGTTSIGTVGAGNITIGTGVANLQQIHIKSGTGGFTSINQDAGASITNIGAGSTTGSVNIGGIGNQAIIVKGGSSAAPVNNAIQVYGEINLMSFIVNAAGPRTINIARDSAITTTNIGTGTTTGNINIGSGNPSSQQINIKGGSGTGSFMLLNHDALASTTNLGSGTTNGLITIGGAAAGQTIDIKSSVNTLTGTVNILSFNTNNVLGAERVVNIANNSSVTVTNIGTGTTTGNVTLGNAANKVLCESTVDQPTSVATKAYVDLVVGNPITATSIATASAGTIDIGTDSQILNINVSKNAVTNIGTGTTASNVNIGGGAANTQNIVIEGGNNGGSISINNNAGTSITNISTGGTIGQVNIGSTANDTGSIVIHGRSIQINDNNANALSTFIHTGSTTGSVSIGGGNAAKSILIGDSSTHTQAISIGTGGNSNTGTVTIGGDGSINQNIILRNNVQINKDVNRNTEINTGTSTGDVIIGNDSLGNVVNLISEIVNINSPSSAPARTITTNIGTNGGTSIIGNNVNIGINAAILQAVRIKCGTATGSFIDLNSGARGLDINAVSASGQVRIGSSTSGQITTIRGGDGGGGKVDINVDADTATTNIGTGNTIGTISIGGGNAAKSILIGESTTHAQSISIGSGGGPNTGTIIIGGSFDTVNNRNIIIRGNVLINHADDRDIFLGNGGGVVVMPFSASSGNHALNRGTADLRYNAISSREMKDNIKPLTDSIDTNKIFNLETKTFTFKQNNKDSFGMIAEDVYEILPELCRINEENKPDAVHYQLLSVLLLEELKKSNAKIAALEQQVADILARL